MDLQLVLNLKTKPDYVILMGDLNYRTNQMDSFAETMGSMFSKQSETSMPGFAKNYYEKF